MSVRENESGMICIILYYSHIYQLEMNKTYFKEQELKVGSILHHSTSHQEQKPGLST